MSDLLVSVGEEFRSSAPTARAETGGFRHLEGEKRQVSGSVGTGSSTQAEDDDPTGPGHCLCKNRPVDFLDLLTWSEMSSLLTLKVVLLGPQRAKAPWFGTDFFCVGWLAKHPEVNQRESG